MGNADKLQLGKLELPAPLPEIIEKQIKTNSIKLLKIELPHILGLDKLPNHHKDPFDRLLNSQALYENHTFVTDDTQIKKYPLTTIW